MLEPCGTHIGHENCGYIYTVEEREVRVASKDSWTRTKKPKYKNKMLRQQTNKKR